MIASGETFPIFLSVVGLFGFGALLIAIAGLSPAGRNGVPELWAFYRSEFVIVGALLVPAMLGVWAFTLFLLALAWRGQVEIWKLFEIRVMAFVPAVAMLAVGFAIASPWFGYADGAPLHLLIGAATIMIVGLLKPTKIPRSTLVGTSIAGLIFPALCCVIAALLRLSPEGLAWIFVVYATVEISDTFAFLAGKLVGTHRVFPKLSPGKTLEGLVAGIVMGTLAGAFLAYGFLDMPLISGALLAALLVIAGIGGDLATSAVKRQCGKKDFSHVLKRHGGALDIYDAFLTAVPVAFLFRLSMAN